MTALCPSSVLACGMRATVLDSLGNVVDDPNNSYVSDVLIQLQFATENAAGAVREQRSGCDCVIAAQRFPDRLLRFTLEMRKGKLEPGLESMLIGSDVVLDGGGDPIGAWWPNNADCGSADLPYIALEVWSQTLAGNRQDPTYPYVHWIWPMTRWALGTATLNSDVKEEVLTGFSVPNSRWGHGPYNDDPGEVIGPMGGYWFTATAPPAAECGYQTVTPSS